MTTLGKPVHAVADPGAEVTLINVEAASRLGIRVTKSSRPCLRPLWGPSSSYRSIGRANVSLQIDDGKPVWTTAVVVDFGQTTWDVLVGKDTLADLGVMLMTPAMLRRVGGAEKIPDHDGKILDSPRRVVEADYDSFPDTAPTHDLSHTSPVEESPAAPAIREPVVSRPMRARVGLPAGFFVPSRDSNFLKWDRLYPEVNVESIVARTNHQCTSEAEVEALLSELIPAKAALREYPSGCPPPAAFAPIRPPMRPDAQPIYVVQHTLSAVAKEAIELVVAERVKYGIDEPSSAFAQMPIFTKAKSGTNERRVLFDDSANNSLNMVGVGMQLPTPIERALFLRDAALISSVDMASFFTQLRLADEVADYWTYDGGSAGKVRTLRMVQGNSESPAIAQAFLTHVLSELPTLRQKLLVYIDNVYLKSTTGDVMAHIADVGSFVRCLAKANVTINMRKSLWCATSDVEVLGRKWSANRSWAAFDHRVETLRNLPSPTSLGAVRRLCGGINSIAEHIEWSQALLAPFYEATGKSRLMRADVEALREPWEALKRALLNVATLYVPPPGAPLVLRTDAAGAGVGAVLLAQRSEDPEDLAPVAYFSRAFGGRQGHKHSTWREACAVYEAVKYFYPYLDGCVNLRIETDCGTVVSLFAHKTVNDADPLAQFKLGLTELGVKKYMIVHRKGELQQTADWLSRAKERLRPDKVKPSSSPEDVTVGGEGVEYVIGAVGLARGELDTGLWTDPDEYPDDDDSDDDEEDDVRPAAEEEYPDDSDDEDADEHPVPTPEEQYGILAGALHDMPRPSEFTDCQQDDEEIKLWVALCQRRDELGEEQTPEFNVVKKKRLRQGVLYELTAGHGNGEAVGIWVPILTRSAATQYVRQVHRALAHPGYVRTYEFVSRHVWCPSLYTVAQHICRHCHVCQTTAIQTVNHTPLVMSQLHGPGEHIYIDFCHIGNRGEAAMSALVIVDSASGFMHAYPMLDETAESLITTLQHGWLSTYRTPQYLTSDNGPQLVSAQFASFLRSLNIHHIKTARYHPQSDLAESAVKKLKTSLQRCWAEAPDTPGWTQYLPRIIAAYSVTVSQSMANSPAAVFFGAGAVVSDDVFAQLPADGTTPSEQQLNEMMMEQVASHRTMMRNRANARANEGTHVHWFKPGEWVTIKPHPSPSNLAELFTRRRGPYRVLARHETSYRLALPNRVPLGVTVAGSEMMLYCFDDDVDPETFDGGFYGGDGEESGGGGGGGGDGGALSAPSDTDTDQDDHAPGDALEWYEHDDSHASSAWGGSSPSLSAAGSACANEDAMDDVDSMSDAASLSAIDLQASQLRAKRQRAEYRAERNDPDYEPKQAMDESNEDGSSIEDVETSDEAMNVDNESGDDSEPPAWRGSSGPCNVIPEQPASPTPQVSSEEPPTDEAIDDKQSSDEMAASNHEEAELASSDDAPTETAMQIDDDEQMEGNEFSEMGEDSEDKELHTFQASSPMSPSQPPPAPLQVALLTPPPPARLSHSRQPQMLDPIPSSPDRILFSPHQSPIVAPIDQPIIGEPSTGDLSSLTLTRPVAVAHAPWRYPRSLSPPRPASDMETDSLLRCISPLNPAVKRRTGHPTRSPEVIYSPGGSVRLPQRPHIFAPQPHQPQLSNLNIVMPVAHRIPRRGPGVIVAEAMSSSLPLICPQATRPPVATVDYHTAIWAGPWTLPAVPVPTDNNVAASPPRQQQ